MEGTLPGTNIFAPEKRMGLEDAIPIGAKCLFSGANCLYGV